MKAKFILPVGILIMTIFTSCASFSKREFSKDYSKLSEGNLSIISGKYKIYPSKRFGKNFKNVDKDSLKYTNIYREIVNEYWKEKNKSSNLTYNQNDYFVQLELIKNNLSVKLFENNILIKEAQLAGKLRKGMFYLDNKQLDCYGIPYIFGGCLNNKRRLAISNNNNLIVNEAVSNEGAFLLLMGSGHRYNSSFEFERIQ
ncbi:hypothetical protein [Pontimicrobium sp. MEBiC06410]